MDEVDPEVIYINTEAFIRDDEDVVRMYEEVSNVDFPTYEEYKNFFIEVGNNHPDGVSKAYFIQLYQRHTTGIAINTLKDLGLVEEFENDDGELRYRVKGKINVSED